MGRRLCVQALHDELGQARRRKDTARALPGREHHPDRFGREPARAEDQRLRRRHVQELRVVDQAKERTVISRRREQAQDRRRDQQAIRARRRREPERSRQRGRLRLGQLAQLVDDRAQQPVQAGEGEVRLRLDAGGAQHPPAAALRGVNE